MENAPAPPAALPVYRRAPTTPRATRELVFDRLPPAVRDRLTRGLASGAPDALLSAPSGAGPLALRASLAVALGAGLGAVGTAARGLGDLDGKVALQPASRALVYAALLAVGALAATAFVALRRFQRGVPFRSGRYLFSLDLVEVEGGRLRVTSLDTVKAVEPRGRQIAVVFEDGHTEVFPTGKQDQAPSVAAQLTRTLASARGLLYPADEARLQRLDPFFELRVTEDWATATDTAPRPRSRLAFAAAGGLLAAAPAGYGLLLARNALSDDLAFDQASVDRRPGQYRTPGLESYVSWGHRHLDEASRLLVEDAAGNRNDLRAYALRGGSLAAMADQALFEQAKTEPEELSRYLRRGGPRSAEVDEALFAVARRMDTVPAYNTYLENGKIHAAEVKDDLLPEADWRQASRSGQIGALFSFVRRHPGGKHDDEAWKTLRAAYAAALPAFRAVERPPAAGVRFAEALLTSLQDRADPRVTLDVQMTPPTAVAAADEVLAAKHGERYLPGARRFSDAALAGLSHDVRAAVGDWFGKAFPGGVVEISRPSAEDEGRPRFEVRCTPVVDGASHWRKRSTAAHPEAPAEPDYVSPLVGFQVEVTATLPGREAGREGKDGTVTWKVHVEDTTDTKMRIRTSGGAERGRREMIEDAFAAFLEQVPRQIAATFHGKL